MSHEPKLTVYTIKLKPVTSEIENSNRFLFRNIINENNDARLDDSYIFTSIFKKFIESLDTPEMYSDSVTRKCMTANQNNIEDSSTNTNIFLHSSKYVIEGKVEGGAYGRKRNKTSTINKSDKDTVDERDAITEDFYFLLYSPLESDKSLLFLQSYSDDSIDTVMKKFWKNFFSCPGSFNQPQIKRYVPESIIEDFKSDSTVSSISFSTDILGQTLLNNTQVNNRNYKVTVKIVPTDEDLSMEEFEQTIQPIQQVTLARIFNLGNFLKKKGTLRDSTTKKSSPFDLGTSFEIQPAILLSKYLTLTESPEDFEKIKTYCFQLLESIKPEIYLHHAIEVR